MAKQKELDDAAIIRRAKKLARTEGITVDDVLARIMDELQLPNEGPMDLESLCLVYFGVLRFKEWSLTEDWGDCVVTKTPIKAMASGRSG
jgi:hypothetical protein